MRNKKICNKLRFSSFAICIVVAFSSFILPPSSLRFFPMLMNKSDVTALMANSNFSYLIIVPSNSGTDDNSRLSYQLVCYAYNSSNQLLTSYSPLKLTKSIPDSTFSKDMYLATYKLTKATLATVIPTSTYSYLRFAPYANRTDALLANYINFSVFPVAPDGVTGVISGKLVPTALLNPSPPR